ncbi:MAG: MFS transporter, partial [Clostridia bacterium]|nr:MFS transporter [Clostridia bacterium]
MEASSPKKLTRWPILLIGVLSMMFAGIIYAWSILKAPLSDTFGWNASELALNFTLTMCLFCIGCFIGGWLAKRVSPKITIGLAGLLAGGGFVLTAYFSASSIVVLYFTYAVMGGLGIGLAYNVILSTVSAWYPDRKGFCSGCLMMGFGASPLILGNLAGTMFDNPGIGWQTTYVVLGIALCVVLVATGFLIKRPGADVTLPEPKQNKANNSEL